MCRENRGLNNVLIGNSAGADSFYHGGHGGNTTQRARRELIKLSTKYYLLKL